MQRFYNKSFATCRQQSLRSLSRSSGKGEIVQNYFLYSAAPLHMSGTPDTECGVPDMIYGSTPPEFLEILF